MDADEEERSRGKKQAGEIKKLHGDEHKAECLAQICMKLSVNHRIYHNL